MPEETIMNYDLLIPHYSFSSLVEFDSCEALYVARKIEGLKDPPTDKMSFGRDFGTAVLRELGLRPHPESPSAKDFDRDSNLMAPESKSAAGFYVAEARRRGVDFTGASAERPLRILPDEWADVCRYYGVEEPGLDRPFIGYPDLEIGDLLVELKTTERLGYQPNYTFQTFLYTLMRNAMGQRTSRIEVHQFKRTKTTQEFTIYRPDMRYENFADVVQWFNEMLLKVKSRLSLGFPQPAKRIGWWCNRCPKLLTCRLYQSTLVSAEGGK